MLIEVCEHEWKASNDEIRHILGEAEDIIGRAKLYYGNFEEALEKVSLLWLLKCEYLIR